MINTRQKLVDLKKKELTFDVGEAIGNILIADKKGGKMKMYVLATKFMEEPEVTLDEADLKMVKSAIESTEIYNSLVAGQLLVMLG